MSQIKDITEKFYTSISNGEIEVIDSLLSNDFELIVPMENGVLSGHYKGKKKIYGGCSSSCFFLCKS